MHLDYTGQFLICISDSFLLTHIPAMLVRVLTPSVSPNKKTFKVVLVCCSHDPYPHCLFLAAFQDLLHLFVLIHQVFPSPLCYFWQLLGIFCICLSSSPVWLFPSLTLFLQKLQCDPALSCSKAGQKVHDNIPPHSACIQIVHRQILIHEKIRGKSTLLSFRCH